MYQELIKNKESEFEDALTHFKNELGKFRTGRANTGLVENIAVDYYGTRTPLRQIASINIPEARLLLIQPWDKGALIFIESAVRESDLGLNPSNDGSVIRISLPPLTEERRKDLVKVLNKEAETARITVRNVREEIWKEIQDLEKEGKLSEDDKFRGKEALQRTVEEYNDKIESLRAKKAEEILTV